MQTTYHWWVKHELLLSCARSGTVWINKDPTPRVRECEQILIPTYTYIAEVKELPSRWFDMTAEAMTGRKGWVCRVKPFRGSLHKMTLVRYLYTYPHTLTMKDGMDATFEWRRRRGAKKFTTHHHKDTPPHPRTTTHFWKSPLHPVTHPQKRKETKKANASAWGEMKGNECTHSTAKAPPRARSSSTTVVVEMLRMKSICSCLPSLRWPTHEITDGWNIQVWRKRLFYLLRLTVLAFSYFLNLLLPRLKSNLNPCLMPPWTYWYYPSLEGQMAK